ncbi:glycosyltransferase [Massilia aerilata]|uniref:Glycosyltransferase n=1 Tax=Massilia aerilata TaxID=453817 RepID=A0ABW0RT98_9BURK
MKIALIITGLGMGGAENQVASLCDYYAAKNHSILLISLTGETVVKPTSQVVRVAPLNMKKNIFSFISAYLMALRLIREFSPDVVHSHMIHANLFARLLRLVQPMQRLICTAHNSNEGGKLRMLAYRYTDNLADITTNVSHDSVNQFIVKKAAPLRKIIAVHNGIDCERFRFEWSIRQKTRRDLNLAEDIHVFFAVGRFADAKDYPNLFSAFSTIARSHKNCVLMIAGSGGNQAFFEAKARELGLANRIHFLGLRRDVFELMNAADTFVLSSAWEGLPLVVGEAMACERVVVSTNAGGVKDFAGDNAFVVPIRDSFALSEAMGNALMLSPEERRQRGSAGRKKIVELYSLRRIAEQWLEMYDTNSDLAERFFSKEESAVMNHPDSRLVD